MSARLLGRHRFTTAEVCAITGDKPDTVRHLRRRGLMEAVNLNEGTDQRPTYRYPARAVRKRLRDLGRG